MNPIRCNPRAFAKAALPHWAAWSCACSLFAGALSAQCQYSATDLVLPDTSYPATTYNAGTTMFQATNSITAAGSNGNFIVSGAASVTFQAGSLIELKPGFHATAGSGAIFHATIAPVAQYQLTMASSPSSAGTVTPSPCSSNG